MAQRSTVIRIRLPAHEELARIVDGVNESVIKPLPEVWKHLSQEERIKTISLIQQLKYLINDLHTVTEEAQRQVQIERNQDLISLLDSWAEASEEEIAEQRETWEFLRKALDDDRLSNRPLFP